MLGGGREGGREGGRRPRVRIRSCVYIFVLFFASLVFNFSTSFAMGYVARLAAPE